MSVKIMSYVFENQALSSTEKLIMLALADHANDEGKSVYPSQGLVSRKTALSRQTVNKYISSLIEEGYLWERGYRADRSNVLELEIVVWKLLEGIGVKDVYTSTDGCKAPLQGVSNPDETGVNVDDTNHHLTITEPLLFKEEETTPKPLSAFQKILDIWSLEGTKGKQVMVRLQRCTPTDNGNGTLVLKAASQDDEGYLIHHALPYLKRQIIGTGDYQSIEIVKGA